MTTPTEPGTRARPALVPHPRKPVEPPADPAPAAGQQPDAERPGMFDQHAWLVPACAIACVIALFAAMILLTWAAGGGTPFDG